MFSWLKTDDGSEGLRAIQRTFIEMLQEGRHIFDAATGAFLGGGDSGVVREDVFTTDQKINHLERKIRRAVVVHGTVHGTSQLPACLVLMSISKDAERIGDYSKNLFQIGVECQKAKGDGYHADLTARRETISKLIAEAAALYASQDEQKALDFMARARSLNSHFDDQVKTLLGSDHGCDQPAATVLCYRYYKRVCAHLLNIITSLVMPLDRLDFYDEPGSDRPPSTS